MFELWERANIDAFRFGKVNIYTQKKELILLEKKIETLKTFLSSLTKRIIFLGQNLQSIFYKIEAER